jgi:drug/metabolite transporter (DMT)-like permease
MRARSGYQRATLALLTAIMLWGSTFIITKLIMVELGPFALTFLRFFIGLLVLAPIARRQGFRLSMIFQPIFLQFGLTGIALFYGLQNLGLTYTSAGNAALIEGGIPAVTALLSFLILKERINRRRLIGVVVTLAGVALVSGVQSTDGGAHTIVGNLLVFGAVLAFSTYTIQGKRLVADYPPVVTTAASFGAGLLFLTPVAAGELLLTGVPAISPLGWLAILYLGIGASAITTFLWIYALQYVDASAAGLYTSLAPVVGIGFAVMLGESTSVIQLVGGALAVAGVWIGNWGGSQIESDKEGVGRGND